MPASDSFLVDTDVISAGAPTKAAARDDLVAWMDANSDRLYLSAVTVAEIEDGLAKARRTGAARKARGIDAWLETLLHLYAARILPFDVDAARVAGRLSDRARASGHAPGFADLAIAGIAVANGLALLSRNVRHFAPLGVKVQDPFRALPE